MCPSSHLSFLRIWADWYSDSCCLTILRKVCICRELIFLLSWMWTVSFPVLSIPFGNWSNTYWDFIWVCMESIDLYVGSSDPLMLMSLTLYWSPFISHRMVFTVLVDVRWNSEFQFFSYYSLEYLASIIRNVYYIFWMAFSIYWKLSFSLFNL